MQKAVGRDKTTWMRKKDMDNFPCPDLRTIDQLWVKYSNGRFGFSVQKRIYQSLGGTRKYDEKVCSAFADRVGWKVKGGEWLEYYELTFNVKAPLGNLPRRGKMAVGVVLWGGFGVWESLLAGRLVDCNP